MTAPPYTSDDGHIVYGKCYASYVRSISDRDGDPDPYPDIELLSGTVKFESVYDSAGARPALPLPALPRTKGIVISGDTYEVKNSNLVDKEGREGVWLVLSVDGIPLTWRATVTLTDERNRVLLNTAYIVTEGVWEVELDGRHVINLPDLIPNPGALTPVEGSALRAAQQTLDEIRVLKGLIDTTKLGVDGSAASALTYRNQAQGFRNEAETFKNTATTQAGLATTAKTAAETARTGAQTARTGAETARTGAETAKSQVDTAKTQIDTTHNHIHQDVTHADTHALAAGASAQTATTKALEASNSAGVATTKATEAAQSRADALTFRNTAQGAATTATTKAGEASVSAQTATTKAAQTAIDALTLAQRVSTGAREIRRTSDGKPYLIPEAQVTEVDLRVDTTAGTRVLLGNTMIFGDTGMRRLASWDEAGAIAGNMPSGLEPTPGIAGYVAVRREGNLVTLMIRGGRATGTDVRVTLVAGWAANSPTWEIGSTRIGTLSVAKMIQYRLGSAHATFYGASSGDLFGDNQYHVVIRWMTTDPWPTFLPGTPG